MFKVQKNGDVYLPVSKDVAAGVLKAKGEKPDIYALNGDESAVQVDSAKGGGEYGLFVGHLKEMLENRHAEFNSLDDLVEYFGKHGRMPWGVMSICRFKGWEFGGVQGCSLAITDYINGERLIRKSKTNVLIKEKLV